MGQSQNQPFFMNEHIPKARFYRCNVSLDDFEWVHSFIIKRGPIFCSLFPPPFPTMKGMAKTNPHYKKLLPTYLFTTIEEKIAALPPKSTPLLNLGIGDFQEPLLPSTVQALVEAAQEMGQTCRGYGPSQGYPFLRSAIQRHDYAHLPIQTDEIFISDGANSDLANLQELFAQKNTLAILSPTYPVYLDTNIMAGRTGIASKKGLYHKVLYCPCTEENQFQPSPPQEKADLLYLCSPNNPTGVALTRKTLEAWVAYALQNDAILFFDGAYEAYIQSPDTPRSIYEIDGALRCAIEVRSFSKSARFTALRCGYTILPKTVQSQGHFLHPLWKRRQDAKTNGVSYPIQKAALSLYTPQGRQELACSLQEKREQSRYLQERLSTMGLVAYGGIDSPYVWCKTPNNTTSWQFFDELLQKTHIVSLPGSGFGLHGEGFVRFSAFPPKNHLEEALHRLEKAL